MIYFIYMRNPDWRNVWKNRLAQLTDSQINLAKNSIIAAKKAGASKIIAKLSFFLFLFVIGSSFLAVIGLAVIARDLPRPDRIVRKEGFSTKIYDRNEKLIYDIFEDQRRTPVQLYEVSKDMQNATVAIEDKDFFKHKGFDPKGYVRIVYYLIFKHRLIGGSTLTQQLVKNVLLSSERTPIRKVKELILSLEIESRYSKDQILQMYLNEAPYGGTAWGTQEAAVSYFGKDAKDLSLIESAILAGLPQLPSAYSPTGSNPEAYIGRTQAVLRRMKEDGYITSEQEEQALKDLNEVKFTFRGGLLKAPHFVMYVKQILEEKYGERVVELGGLRVTTSVDLDLQEKAQSIVSEEIKKVEKLNITNGAVVIIDPKTGEVLAMIGSKNYDDPDYDGKFNVVTAKRQPGSAIKPVTYVTALKKGLTASTMLVDVSTTFPGGDKKEYIPVNYDGKEHGPLQLRYALGNSINIVAVKTLALVGIKEMLTTAFDMGLTTLEPTGDNLRRFGLSLTLGGGEVKLIDLASAYSAFANGGYKVEPVVILKVTDKDGNVLEEFKPLSGKQVLSSGEAFIISNILSDNEARKMTFGENSALKISGRQVAVKTGTTNDRRDNWTIGWSPQVIVGVWVGNNDNSMMKQLVSGISGAAPIWRGIITEYLKNKQVEEFSVPEGVVQFEVDSVSGFKAHDGFPQRSEYFIKGTEPTAEDPIHPKLKLCQGQSKLATTVDIAKNNYEEKEFFVFKESDPFENENKENKWQKGIDAWLAKQTDERYHPPTEYCNNSDNIYIKFNEPSDQSQIGNDFTLRIETVSFNEVVKIEVYLDGNLEKTLTSYPYELVMKLPDGKHTIKAVATDVNGNQASQETRFGINVPWNLEPSPTPMPVTPTLTPTLTLTPIPI